METVIRLFNRHRVRYLVIGGQAMRLEGMPRFSMDWDFLIPPKDAANIELVNRILGDELDLPLEPLGPRGQNAVQTYQTRWGVLQFHLGVPGLRSFEEAEKSAVIHKGEGGVRARCVSGAVLLAMKKASGRPQDQADIAFLERKKKAGLL